MFWAGTVLAAMREDVLFEEAYTSYFSYHPEIAAENFELFLTAFPDSSALDAAMFWKAKSLMQLRRTDEAIKTFAKIRERFPESPFILYVDKELSEYGADGPDKTHKAGTLRKTIVDEQDNIAWKTSESLQQVITEKEDFLQSLADKDKEIDRLKKVVAGFGEKERDDLKGKDLEIRALTVKVKEQAKEREESDAVFHSVMQEKAAVVSKLKESESGLTSLQAKHPNYENRNVEGGKDDRIELLTEELKESGEMGIKLQKQIEQCRERLVIRATERESLLSGFYEKKEGQKGASLKDIIRQYEAPAVAMGRNTYSLKQILDDWRISSEVIKKIGATNILWRSDNPFNNFILEQALLQRAGDLGIKEDGVLLNSFLAQYSFDKDETRYLESYLTINDLINKKLGEIVSDEKYIRKYFEISSEAYRELKKKIYQDQAMQARLLQGWFYELANETEVMK